MAVSRHLSHALLISSPHSALPQADKTEAKFWLSAMPSADVLKGVAGRDCELLLLIGKRSLFFKHILENKKIKNTNVLEPF